MGLWARRLLCLAVAVGMCASLSCSGDNGEIKGGPGGDGDASGDGSGPNGEDPDCVNTRTYFAQQLWTPVLDAACIGCHSPDGVATEQNALLQLLPSAYPGFLDANYENVKMMVQHEFDGVPTILRKPLGEMDHGGGAPLTEDSEEYQALVEFVELLDDEDACDFAPSPPAFDDVQMLDAHGTFRKATIQLAGRVPTSDEASRLADEGEDALPSMLDDLLEEDAFLERLKDIYNDVLLTDLYLRYNGAAVNLLNAGDYPNVADETYDILDEDFRLKANRALAREPLELISYVVKNDRPFSEILTANYTVVNPFSSALYGVYPEFADDNDEDEFQEVQIRVMREEGDFSIPHAGVLTMPVLLNRMPTTPTNRNRHRARRVLEIFLATDILRIGTRPIDSAMTSQYNNPTRDDPQCTGCHRQIDPIAGAFLKWDDRDQERYFPDQEWHQEMFPPGFGKEVMDVGEYDRAQAWLTQRIVADPRFVLATVHTMYRGVTGNEPLLYPGDPNAEDFDQQRAAWEAQDRTFRQIGEAFTASGMNLKAVVREIVLTPYFRAANADELSTDREVELLGVGTGRFSIPKVLANKIAAVTGLRWARSWDRTDYLMSDYKILYGGIDSDSVTERLTTPNGIMANLGWRMANEVACTVTAMDFNKPEGERLLFPEVMVGDMPETPSGDDVPAAIERIRANIKHLHAQVLDERLEDDDPELERTYELFYETWKEGSAKVESEELGRNLTWACQARVDPETGEDLPDEERLNQDEGYTIRAWMAVMTYLLSDYGFLYE